MTTISDDHNPRPILTAAACTQCGYPRMQRLDGTPGACSYVPCARPFYDVELELELATRPVATRTTARSLAIIAGPFL